MGYYIDLKNIKIDKYKEVLKKTELVPSWKVLGENIDKNLNIIKNQHIENLDELLVTLEDKDKILIFSKQSGLSANYLEVLRRVVNGYRQKPNKIKDFHCVPEVVSNKLDKLGIKNTLRLYDEILPHQKRTEFSQKAGISTDEVIRLTKLTDLSRIR